MKTLLFIPGFYEGLHDSDYPSVLETFESRGYKTKFVPINWQRTTLTHWLDEFNSAYEKHDPGDTAVAGFSFGAVTAFVAAAKRNPAELWLCSLSPIFDGDNPKPQWLKEIGKRRVEAFANTDFQVLAKKIKCPTRILYGTNEFEETKQRAHIAHSLLTNSRLIEVPDTGHDVTAKNYLAAIKNA